jgi:hypothetical protein
MIWLAVFPTLTVLQLLLGDLLGDTPTVLRTLVHAASMPRWTDEEGG